MDSRFFEQPAKTKMITIWIRNFIQKINDIKLANDNNKKFDFNQLMFYNSNLFELFQKSFNVSLRFNKRCKIQLLNPFRKHDKPRESEYFNSCDKLNSCSGNPYTFY